MSPLIVTLFDVPSAIIEILPAVASIVTPVWALISTAPCLVVRSISPSSDAIFTPSEPEIVSVP